MNNLLSQKLTQHSTALGIDIGGTKIAAGVVTSSGQIVSFCRCETPTNLDPEGLLRVVVTLAREACQDLTHPVAALGVGCGGPMIFPQGLVSPIHIPTWRNFALLKRLEEELALLTVLDNDAKAFALGDAIFGGGRDCRSVLGLVVSTGIGGGIVVDGRLHHGASGNSGHIGHVVVSPRGLRCWCGGRGCVTVYASGRGMVARARHALEHGVQSSLALLPSYELTGQAITVAAAQGDMLSRKLMHDAAFALACGIVSVANLLDLDRVVLGGGLSGAKELLIAPIHRELQRRLQLPFTRDLQLEVSPQGEAAGVLGAAALIFQHLKH